MAVRIARAIVPGVERMCVAAWHNRFRMNLRLMRLLFRENLLLLAILGLFALLPVAVASVVVVLFHEQRDVFLEAGIASIALFLIVSAVAMALALTPSTVVAVLCGHFFGWVALPGVVGSYVAAAALGLLLGKLLDRTVTGARLLRREEVRAYFERLRGSEVALVAFGRLSPILPFAMMSVAFASIRVSWRGYLIGTALGMFPRTFLFFWLGMHAADIWEFAREPDLEGAYGLIPAALVAVSAAGLVWLLVRAGRRRAEAAAAQEGRS